MLLMRYSILTVAVIIDAWFHLRALLPLDPDEAHFIFVF